MPARGLLSENILGCMAFSLVCYAGAEGLIWRGFGAKKETRHNWRDNYQLCAGFMQYLCT
jgi:hypothetical protein